MKRKYKYYDNRKYWDFFEKKGSKYKNIWNK